ncbi:MAG TPA: hypothetical protein VJM11_01260 [Nevskiaceae bacterium]|nr:hypothetical protein [Nevskiaceae bacterium]
MIFHGTVVLLIGLLAGFPFLLGIVSGAEQRRVDAWRAAHTGLCSSGVMGIAIGACVLHWQATGTLATVTAWGIVVGSYGITVAMTLAAISGARGLKAGGSLVNNLVYASYMIGVPGVLAGTGAFLLLALDRVGTGIA